MTNDDVVRPSESAALRSLRRCEQRIADVRAVMERVERLLSPEQAASVQQNSTSLPRTDGEALQRELRYWSEVEEVPPRLRRKLVEAVAAIIALREKPVPMPRSTVAPRNAAGAYRG